MHLWDGESQVRVETSSSPFMPSALWLQVANTENLLRSPSREIFSLWESPFPLLLLFLASDNSINLKVEVLFFFFLPLSFCK